MLPLSVRLVTPRLAARQAKALPLYLAPRRFSSKLSSHHAQDEIESPHGLSIQLAKAMKLPLFAAKAEQIKLLDTPSSFYQTLKEKIDGAQDRIFLASLYIGKEETELISCIRQALTSRPGLRLTILTDALRSTREVYPAPSGASLVASLARDFPDQVDLRLFHTPRLKGLTKKLVGKRFNEGWGLQHMKIYGFDNDVITSGANLSRDYFTNRRDRYMIVERHRQISDYLHSLVLLVSRFSYSLTCTEPRTNTDSPKAGLAHEHCNYRLEWDGGDKLLLGEDTDGSVSEAGALPILSEGSVTTFREGQWDTQAQRAVEQFTSRWHSHTLDLVTRAPSQDTLLVPLLQMGPLKIRQETEAIPQLFSLAESSSSSVGSPSILDLTSGYFSLYPAYKALLASPRPQGASARVRIICAAPESNGFFGSRGVSGWIPEGYTWFEKKFWNLLRRNQRLDGPNGGVEIREWKKEGWTYHAKGLWFTPAQETSVGPRIAHIGSSNYGSRSSDLDLECTLLVSTESDKLSQRLKEEVDALRSDAVDLVNQNIFDRPDRKVRTKVKFTAWLIGGML